MLSSLGGKQFEPVEISSDNFDFIICSQDEYRIPKLIHDRSPIIVHYLQSSEKATQSDFYVDAKQLIYQNYPEIYNRMEFKPGLLNKEIRKKGMHPEDVINFLLASNIHLIYSHVHQGKILTIISLFIYDIYNFQHASRINSAK